MASALDQVEAAVALLREAGLSALARHWTGSVPFAFGVLAFWQTVTGPRVSDATCAAGAFAMTGLLVWMSCWRAVFAAGLRRRLHGEPAAAPVRMVLRNQVAAAGWKLVLMPVAAITMVPIAWATAFFRGLAALSDLEPVEAWSRARRLAGFEQRVNWAGIAILTLVWVAAFLNIAVALAMLPQLIQALTGYESEFSRIGPAYVLNRLFFLCAGLVAWVAVDPLIQAFYCVQCFRGESVETGADLRARLRAIRRSAEAAAPLLLLLAALAAPMTAEVTQPELKQSIEQTLRAHEYDWRLPPEALARQRSWLVSFTDRLVSEARRLLRMVVRMFERLIRWLLDQPMAPTPQGTPPSAGLSGSLWLLIVAAVMAGVAVLWRLRFRSREAPGAAAALPAVDPTDESLTADRLPEDQWYALGEQCLQRGDYRAALRAYYLGNLAWLAGLRLITLHTGKTNREYEREMRRRGRAVQQAPPLLAANIDAVERCWYGRHAAAEEDVGALRERLRRMKELLAQ